MKQRSNSLKMRVVGSRALHAVLIFFFFLITVPAVAHDHPALIPEPRSVSWQNGTFALKPSVAVRYDAAALKPAADLLAGKLRTPTGYKVPVGMKRGQIRLSLNPDGGKQGGYSLTVTPREVTIVGNDYQGVVSGIATLLQLLPPVIAAKSVVLGQWTVPCVSIQDEPRYAWRGMELDCSRHFFSKAEVEELLDVLQAYKINRLHWHLTDDQGWRIEIKRYPKLTENGGWRTPNNQDSVCLSQARQYDDSTRLLPEDKMRTIGGRREYGGYYTQDDIREIVAYARDRGIDIVPEIDMPGHSLIAVRNYDGLSCFPETGWGQTFSTPLCPSKDRVLEFCRNVLSEVMELFPYPYIHLGGDEVEYAFWRKCPDCKKRMEDNGLKTPEALQSWFMHQMEDFLNAHGRKMIGWDEIVEGGLSPTSTVMWWRSWSPEAPKQATDHGNQVVLCPNAQFYLDYDEDANSLDAITTFSTDRLGVSADRQDLLLGFQGNLWTEWVPTRQRMFYRAFPRIMAVAELGWDGTATDGGQSFRRRLSSHFERLQQMGVTYRMPSLTGFCKRNVFLTTDTLRLSCLDPTVQVRYTTDGTLPQASSARYPMMSKEKGGGLPVTSTTHFTLRTFGADGRKGDFVTTDFVKEALAPRAKPESQSEGLNAVWRDYRGPSCAGIDTAKVAGRYVTDGICIPDGVKGNIGLMFYGFIEVPADGIYTFTLSSDDGSLLRIDDVLVVDNDGEHSPRTEIGQHAMQAGLHPVHARYFDHNGGLLGLKVTDAQGREVNVKWWH